MPASSVELDFRVRGKMGVHDGAKGFSATFDWRQTGERYDIFLRAPFGQGQVRLTGDGEAVSATSPSGVVREGENPQAFLQSILGWSLPVVALRHWVRGRYDPALSATRKSYDEDGNLAAFHQHGWTVRLSNWQAVAGESVPGKIVARRQQRRITVVCKDWQFD